MLRLLSAMIIAAAFIANPVFADDKAAPAPAKADAKKDAKKDEKKH